MVTRRYWAVAGAIVAASFAGANADAAMMVNSTTYGTHYDVWSAETGGRTLIQEFFISETTTIETLEFYGWAADAEFALLRSIGATTRQEDEIWRSSFSSMEEGWHDLGGPRTLTKGTYYLVMQSNSEDPADATWFRAHSPSRVGLGAFSYALSEPNLYAPSTVHSTFGFGSMAMRIEVPDIPAPGALALAGIAGVAAGRRRR